MKPKRKTHPTTDQIKAAMIWWRISAGFMRADNSEALLTKSLQEPDLPITSTASANTQAKNLIKKETSCTHINS